MWSKGTCSTMHHEAKQRPTVPLYFRLKTLMSCTFNDPYMQYRKMKSALFTSYSIFNVFFL